MTAESGLFSKNKNKGQSSSYEERWKNWGGRVWWEKKRRKGVTVADFRSQRAWPGEEGRGFWPAPRPDVGGADPGEWGEDVMDPLPQASVIPPCVEGKTLWACLCSWANISASPLQAGASLFSSQLRGPSERRPRAVRRRSSWPPWPAGTMAEAAWRRAEGTTDTPSPLPGLITWMTAMGSQVSPCAHSPWSSWALFLPLKANQVAALLKPFHGPLLSSG